MALRICSIASGSKGNCIYIGSERTSLLLDFGVSPRRVNGSLARIGAGATKDVFVTHTHSDHIRYLSDVSERGATVHYNRILHSGLYDRLKGGCDEFSGDVCVGDITVSSFPVSHDVPCFGYSFYSEGSKITVVTDLGIMPQSTLDGIADSDVVFLESNYDPVMLKNNYCYPEYLKARIAGTRGHLSNGDSAECAAYLAGRGVKHIILGHLSEQNNTPSLALRAAEEALGKYNLSGKVVLHVAVQNEMSEVIEV